MDLENLTFKELCEEKSAIKCAREVLVYANVSIFTLFISLFLNHFL